MDIAEKFRLNRITLIGSGGCTAFCLKAFSPEMEIALIEPNPSQIKLIKEKNYLGSYFTRLLKIGKNCS